MRRVRRASWEHEREKWGLAWPPLQWGLDSPPLLHDRAKFAAAYETTMARLQAVAELLPAQAGDGELAVR